MIVMPYKYLKCVTWNVHRAKGADGKVDPDRIRQVIATELATRDLGILALQEADEECRPHRRILDVTGIAADTGLVYQHTSLTMRWNTDSDGFLGTILFLHPRFAVTHLDVLDLPGHCHRGAVSIEAVDGNIPFRIISTHLSLSQPIRIVQMRIIGQYLFRRPDMQTVLLGDFNEWRPWGGLMFNKQLVGRRFFGPARATFPARAPLLPLDRILSDREGAVLGVMPINSKSIRAASDHLPLVGTITVS